MRTLIALAALSALPVYADTGGASICVRSFSLRDLNPMDGIAAAFRFGDNIGNTLYESTGDYDVTSAGNIAGIRVTSSGGSFSGSLEWRPGGGYPLASQVPSMFLAPHTAFDASAVGRIFGSGDAFAGIEFGGQVYESSGTFSQSHDLSMTIENNTSEWMEIFPTFGVSLYVGSGG